MIPIATNTNNNKYKKLVMILSDILKCTLTEGMNDKINRCINITNNNISLIDDELL